MKKAYFLGPMQQKKIQWQNTEAWDRQSLAYCQQWFIVI
jgi:hypothetical protein